MFPLTTALCFSPVYGLFCVSPSSPPHSSLSQRPWWKCNYSSFLKTLHYEARNAKRLQDPLPSSVTAIFSPASCCECDANKSAGRKNFPLGQRQRRDFGNAGNHQCWTVFSSLGNWSLTTDDEVRGGGKQRSVCDTAPPSAWSRNKKQLHRRDALYAFQGTVAQLFT